MTDTLPEPQLEVFPVAVGTYLHHDNLDVATEVEDVAQVLAEYGGNLVPWGDWTQERGEKPVHERMAQWAQSLTGNTFLYWAGHGWATDDRAVLLCTHSDKSPTDKQGIVPAQLAEWIYQRERHNQGSDTWAIIVVDTCRSAQFVERLNAELDKLRGARRLLLIGVSGEGTTNLGVFSHALRTALRDTFAAEPHVDLWELGKELLARLPSHNPPIPRHVHRLVMRRRIALPTQATLDTAQAIQAALMRLGDDERYHYVPKAQGGELREFAWYFEGRSHERQAIVDWLRTTAEGVLVVTGRAGSGKSALLGNLLVHSRPELRQAMIDTELLEPLLENEQPPDDVFSATAHLTGLTAADLLARIADDLALPAPDAGATLAKQTDTLIAGIRERAIPVTILIDALDESDDPLGIAQAVLRPLSVLPDVRLLIGTRRSAFESPGDEEPPDRDLLDALDVQPNQTVTVGRDPHAFRRYIYRRLATAAKDESLRAEDVTDATIEHVAATLGKAAEDFLFARLAVHEILADPGIVLPDPSRMDDLDELTHTTHRGLFARAVSRLRRRSRVNYWLLAALAYAQGRGLPLRDGVWAAVANALSDGTETASQDDISTLLEHAAPYLAIDRDHGQTVYRLAHRAFIEHFTDTAQNQRRHRAITQRLIALGTDQLNPYLVHHLPAHAGAGGEPAWQDLAAHSGILDELNPTGVTGAVMRTAFGRFVLPHPITGIVGASHLLASAPSEDRALLRWLSVARHTGSVAEPTDGTGMSGRWRLRWARLIPRPFHIILTGRSTARSPSRDHSDSIRAITTLDLPRRAGLIATGQTSGITRLWDPLTGGQAGEGMSRDGAVSAIVPIQLTSERDSPERVALAIATDDGIHIWDPAMRLLVMTITSVGRTRFRALIPVRWPDGRTLLAAGADDGTIGIWDPVTGARQGHHTQAHDGSVNAIVALYPPHPGVLATYGEDGMIRIWDHHAGLWRQSGELTPGPRRPKAGYALATVRLDPKRTLLVSAGHDAVVRLWEPAMEKPVAELRGHRNAIRSVVTVRMPGGTPAIATAGDDRTIRLWDPHRHRELGPPLTGHTAQVLGITQLSLPDGPAVLATSSRDSSVRLWELAETARIRSSHCDTTAVTVLAEIRAEQESSVVAVGHDDGSVRLLDVDTGEPAQPPLQGNTVAVRAMSTLAITAKLNLLAVGGSDRVVKVWNFADGVAHLFKVIPTGLGSVSALALISAGDGTIHLVIGGRDGAIEFWDLNRALRVGYEPTAHKKHVSSLTAVQRPRGDLLVASGGHDQTIRFWNPVTATRGDLPPIDNRAPFSAMLQVPGHLGDPLIAVASQEDRVRLRVWNTVTGAVEGRPMSSPPIKGTGAPSGGGGKVTALTTMRTDIGHDLLITGNTNHTIGLWDLATRTLLHRLDFGDEITACHAFNERLIVGSESGVTLLELNRKPD